MKRIKFILLFLLVVVVLPFGLGLAQNHPTQNGHRTWYNASRDSAGIAPDPVEHANLAIVQIYVAPTFGWKGYFAVHPWIIFKRSGEKVYTRYDVIGWSRNKVRKDYALPDGLWFGADPQMLVDRRGDGVNELIEQIEAAITSYPFKEQYHIYPGPNSNTFIAHIGRSVPALNLDLPANAIGKDYRPFADPVGLSPSGHGVQANLLGLLGVTLGIEEGIEVNVLGLNFGIDFNRPALRLPSIGRLGMADTPSV